MKVFISHAHKDEPLAKRVANVLEEAGLDVWDENEILPGDNWAAKIGEALQKSDAMVVLLTPDALRSSHVRREISYALGQRRYSDRLIPVLAADPGELQKDFPWILHTLNVINLPERDKDEEGIRQIAHALMAVA